MKPDFIFKKSLGDYHGADEGIQLGIYSTYIGFSALYFLRLFWSNEEIWKPSGGQIISVNSHG